MGNISHSALLGMCKVKQIYNSIDFEAEESVEFECKELYRL
jgi:hypothetical protein